MTHKDAEAELEVYHALRQKGCLKWEDVTRELLSHMFDDCCFPDSLIATLYEIPKKEVTKKRKAYGISNLNSMLENAIKQW